MIFIVLWFWLLVCRNYTNNVYTNGFNLITQYTKEIYWIFLQLNVENKHDRQSQQVKERNKSNHNIDIFLGKACCSKPFYLLLYITKESWKNYNALFSQESHALSQLSHIVPDKIDQHLANYQPLYNLPCLCNSWWMKSLFFSNFGLPKLCKDHGQSNGCIVAHEQPNNDTTDS